MGGVLILFLGTLYIWGAAKVVGLVKPNGAKVLLILVFVLIPTADAIYGRIKLHQMCEAEGGLRIYRVVEGVEGFYQSSWPEKTWISEYGFTFSEGVGDASGLSTDRLVLQPNGQIELEKNVQKRSQYRLRFQNGEVSDIYTATEMLVETIDGKDVLGRMTNFSFAGGWVEQAIAGLYAARGDGGSCNLNPYIYALTQDLVLATLKTGNSVKIRSTK